MGPPGRLIHCVVLLFCGALPGCIGGGSDCTTEPAPTIVVTVTSVSNAGLCDATVTATRNSVDGALSLASSPTNGSSGSCSYMTYSGDHAATYDVAVSAPEYQPATVHGVTAPPPHRQVAFLRQLAFRWR